MGGGRQDVWAQTLRREEAGREVVRTCGDSLPVISVFSVKLFPMTQSMVRCVGLVFYNCLRFSFAEAR